MPSLECEQHNRASKANPLKKPGGFHWDFFLLGATTFISSILFIPFPNGLVPQAPVHTDSLTVRETRLKRFSSGDTEQVEEDIVAVSRLGTQSKSKKTSLLLPLLSNASLILSWVWLL